MRGTAISVLAFAALAAQSHAFLPGAPALMRGAIAPALRNSVATSSVRSMRMAAVPILITGNNIEVTPALKDYVNEKFGNALSKVGRRVTKCDVHLIFDKNPAVATPNNVEVTLFAKGATIRAHKKADDMYATIDEVSDMVKRKLRKYKERVIDSHRGGKETDVTAEEIEAFMSFNEDVAADMANSSILEVPPPDMSKIKRKTFNMEPISLEDAVLCLEYNDHDFYAFKNKDNGNKASIVYARNSGGIGLIELV